MVAMLLCSSDGSNFQLVADWCAMSLSDLRCVHFLFCVVCIANLWPLIGIYARFILNRLSSLADVAFGGIWMVFLLTFFTDKYAQPKLILIIWFFYLSLQLMCLADLEFDYINPFDSSSRINKVVMPEFILQAVLSVLFLLSGHWAMFLLSVPMVYYNYTL